MTKTCVIGLDGATLDLIEPWAQQGKLPVLQKIMDKGSYSRLKSVMPVLSSAAWPSFMTGMNPGKHGMYDFVQRDPTGYRLRIVGREHMHAPSLWKILSQNNRKVIVMNVPMTYPPETVNGCLVSGLGTPEGKVFTHPPELGDQLLKRGYRVNSRVYYSPGNEKAYLQEAYELVHRQLEGAVWLMESQDWDLFMLVFFDTDQVTHYFWRHMDATHPYHDPKTDAPFSNAIMEYFQEIDKSIGQLVKAAGADTNVIIVSDHGAGPCYQDVYLNEWLRQEGYLHLETGMPQYQGSRRILARLGLTRQNIRSALIKTGFGWLASWLQGKLGEAVFILPRTRHAEFPLGINWSTTRAYSFGYQGQIYINLKGREPQGIVSAGREYDEICQEIRNRLLELVDPQDGKRVVDEVFLKNALFQGPCIDLAPDLTLVMRGLAYTTRYGYELGSEPGKLFSRPANYESACHRQDGILIACGPNVKSRGYLEQGVNLVDLAPSILHLMDCRIPSTMDGQYLEDILKTPNQPSYTEGGLKPSVSTILTEQLSPEEENQIRERLRNMGYLD